MSYIWEYVESPEQGGNGYLQAYYSGLLYNENEMYFMVDGIPFLIMDVTRVHSVPTNWRYFSYSSGRDTAALGSYTNNVYLGTHINPGDPTNAFVYINYWDFNGNELGGGGQTQYNYKIKHIVEVSTEYLAVIMSNYDDTSEYLVPVKIEGTWLHFHYTQKRTLTRGIDYDNTSRAYSYKKYQSPGHLDYGGYSYQISDAGVSLLGVNELELYSFLTVENDLTDSGRDGWMFDKETAALATLDHNEEYFLDAVTMVGDENFSLELLYANVAQPPAAGTNNPIISTNIGEVFVYDSGQYVKVVNANEWAIDECPMYQAMLASGVYHGEIWHIWYEDADNIYCLTPDYTETTNYTAIWKLATLAAAYGSSSVGDSWGLGFPTDFSFGLF
jgi:hypothetical protein